VEVTGFPTSTTDLFAAVSVAMFVYIGVELILLHFRRRTLRLAEARTAACGFLSIVAATVLIARFWGPFGVALMATVGASLSPVDSLGLGPVGWLYGWFVYEFWYWVQHWAAHKVRLLWCIHSPHHAPRSLHMLIGTNHHLLESVFYMPFFAGFATAILGVDPLVCLGLNFVDSIWGSFLHISDDIVPRGRYGVLGRALQTPAHHRVHHAKNVRYLDRNYCSITLFWDWVFGTLEPLRDAEPPEYGITRDVDTGSFWDVHFREFVLLRRDVRAARGWRDRLGFVLRPPGWLPGDDSQTASARQRALRPLTSLPGAR
jgi:sterol desaturase/sphingolipid hydroxylase (fatty acid hydroxylase superfamily)